MKRWLLKTSVVALAILLAELFSLFCLHEIEKFQKHVSAYEATAISMAAAVLFFYPVLEFSQKYLQAISRAYIKGARKAAKGNFLLVLAGILLALFLLFAAFAYLKYNKNVFKDMANAVVKMF